MQKTSYETIRASTVTGLCKRVSELLNSGEEYILYGEQHHVVFHDGTWYCYQVLLRVYEGDDDVSEERSEDDGDESGGGGVQE